METINGEAWMTLDEAEAKHGFPARTIRRWIKAGHLTALRRGLRLYLVRDADVATMRRRPVEPAAKSVRNLS